MKKIICLLLSFIVLLSSFVLPVSALTEDDYYEIYFNSAQSALVDEQHVQTFNARSTESTENGELLLRRGIYSKNSSGLYYPVSSTSIFSDNLTQMALYTIENSYTENSGKEYFQYYNISRVDNTALVSSGNDLEVSYSGFYDVFLKDETEYNFYLTKIKSITCGYINKDGVSVSLDPSCVYLRQTSNAYYSLTFKLPNQEEDIYTIWTRVYFDLDNMLSFVPNQYMYGMNEGSISYKIEKADKATGLLAEIKDFISNIFEWIGNFFTNLKNALDNVVLGIKNALNNAVNFVLEGLKTLFIPQDGFFADRIDDLTTLISDKLGILTLPFTVISDGLHAYLQLGESDGIIYLPGFKIFDTQLIPKGNIDFDYHIDNWNLEVSTVVGFDVWNLYLTAVDVICIVAFLNLCLKKFHLIIMNVPTE